MSNAKNRNNGAANSNSNNEGGRIIMTNGTITMMEAFAGTVKSAMETVYGSGYSIDVFESIIDRVIVGEKSENGEINPYKLRFIFKIGYEKEEVASEQPFSFANSCSDTDNDCGIISLQGDNDTCRSRMFIVQAE